MNTVRLLTTARPMTKTEKVRLVKGWINLPRGLRDYAALSGVYGTPDQVIDWNDRVDIWVGGTFMAIFIDGMIFLRA